jgi:hypothetical protein
MEYHKTKDVFHVKELLGHRSLDSTLIYINIERAVFGSEGNDEFHVKVAKAPEEIKTLLEAGFEYMCGMSSCSSENANRLKCSYSMRVN